MTAILFAVALTCHEMARQQLTQCLAVCSTYDAPSSTRACIRRCQAEWREDLELCK